MATWPQLPLGPIILPPLPCQDKQGMASQCQHQAASPCPLCVSLLLPSPPLACRYPPRCPASVPFSCSLALPLTPPFLALSPRPPPTMEYEKSGFTSKDIKRYALVKDPSTVTVMDSENLGGGVETGSTGARDLHSDATSEKHATPSPNDDRKEDIFSSSGAVMVSDLGPTTEDSYGGGLYGTESSPMCTKEETGHASDYQSAEGMTSDMPDRKGIHEPPSSGDRCTDITGISYIQ